MIFFCHVKIFRVFLFLFEKLKIPKTKQNKNTIVFIQIPYRKNIKCFLIFISYTYYIWTKPFSCEWNWVPQHSYRFRQFTAFSSSKERGKIQSSETIDVKFQMWQSLTAVEEAEDTKLTSVWNWFTDVYASRWQQNCNMPFIEMILLFFLCCLYFVAIGSTMK